MKRKYLKILIVLLILIINPIISNASVERNFRISNRFQASDRFQISSRYTINLPKYEFVFIYPEGQEEEVQKAKAEVETIYKTVPEKLIITEKKYTAEDCNLDVLAKVELQGDITYKSIVFMWTNSEMCEPIKTAIENTSPNCKLNQRLVRQTVMTIPIEEETSKSLEEWKQDKTEWCNYRYEANTSDAIDETYNILNTTKEKVEKANNEQVEQSIPAVEENNVSENNEDINYTSNPKVNYDNTDIKVTNTVEAIKIVLSNGNVFTPEIVEYDKTKILYMDKELMHGATVYIQYGVSVEKITDNNIKDYTANLEYDTDQLNYDYTCNLLTIEETNEEQGWEMVDNQKLQNANLALGSSRSLVISQVITAYNDIEYCNTMSGYITYEEEVEGEEGMIWMPREFNFNLESEDIKVIAR